MLAFALLESLLVTGLLSLLGLLTPRRWQRAELVTRLNALTWLMAIWGLVGKYPDISTTLINLIWRLHSVYAHPLQLLYIVLAGLGAVVLLSVALPLFIFERAPKILAIAGQALERLQPLAVLYLVIDGLALLVIFVRNS